MMIYRMAAMVGFIVAVFLNSVSAQNTAINEQVDQIIETTMIQQNIPGLALAVIQNGEVVMSRGYGWADSENMIPVTDATLFETASIAKPLFAVALLQLVEAGQIGLDNPVSMYLPEVPSSWSDVTVRQIFTHTSGLPYSGNLPVTYTQDEMLEAIQKVSLDSTPGTQWEYSDFGYQVLALILERVSGQSRANYLREYVFDAADMPTAQISTRWPENTAIGYRPTRNGIIRSAENETDQPLISNGGIFLSLQDYIAWDNALSQGTLLNDEMLAEMTTAGSLNDGSEVNYGLGWTVREVNGGRVLEHGGGSLNVVNRYIRYVDDGLSIVMLSNLAFSSVSHLPYQIAALYNPMLAEPEPAVVNAVIDDPFPEVTELLQRYFKGCWTAR